MGSAASTFNGDALLMTNDNSARSRQVSFAESMSDTVMSDYKLRSRQVSQSGFLPRVQTGSIATSRSCNLLATMASADNSSYCEPNLSPPDGLKSGNNSNSNSNSCDQVGESPPYDPWKHPLSLYAVSIFIAWVYIIIPVTSFWEFALV